MARIYQKPPVREDQTRVEDLVFKRKTFEPQHRVAQRSLSGVEHVRRYGHALVRYSALLLFSLTCQAAPIEEPPIHFVVTDTWGMPLLQSVDGTVVGGILFDLQQRLAKSVGRSAKITALPRRRIHQLMSLGEIDVLCYSNPAWLQRKYDKYLWSVPFMIQGELLVGRAPENIRPQDLKGQIVGTVLGFVYPALDPLFADEHLLRDDARTQEQVLQKLLAGRYQYAVSDTVSLDYFNSKHPSTERLWRVSDIASHAVSCLVRDDPQVPTQRLLKSIEHLQETGAVEDIIKSYR
ncbi:substrate-binding periplasmic protein [Pseudomonas sp. NPDC086278]|uniref:substrate-binding periplasmic protein n=1 Tax=Pseudomonas sp. NPDC086278 TaxID=3390646 RepID=UPI003D012709